MKSATKHIVISTILCALTLVVFLAFYNRLPASIPSSTLILPELQILSSCNVVVFGVPVALCPAEPHFWLYRQPERECKSRICTISWLLLHFVATGIMIYLGMK